MNPTPRQLQILRFVHGLIEYRRYGRELTKGAGA